MRQGQQVCSEGAQGEALKLLDWVYHRRQESKRFKAPDPRVHMPISPLINLGQLFKLSGPLFLRL